MKGLKLEAKSQILKAPVLACKWNEWKRYARTGEELRESKCTLLPSGSRYRRTESLVDTPSLTAIRSKAFKGVRYALDSRLQENTQ